MLSYELKHKDGRISFPLVLINWSPTTSETSMLTLHASALINFQTAVRFLQQFSILVYISNSLQADVGKVIEMRDGPEGFTKEEIDAKLLM